MSKIGIFLILFFQAIWKKCGSIFNKYGQNLWFSNTTFVNEKRMILTQKKHTILFNSNNFVEKNQITLDEQVNYFYLISVLFHYLKDNEM